MTSRVFTPRGIRNNNPGNVEKGAAWQGLSKDQSDSRFCVFDAPEYGLRCIMVILRNYSEKHGIYTINKIIHRYAPPSENSWLDYINFVCNETKLAGDEELDMSDPNVMKKLVKAIVRYENGIPVQGDGAKEWYPDQLYDKALQLAGFPPAVKPLSQSRTMAGAAVGLVGATASMAFATVAANPDPAFAESFLMAYIVPFLSSLTPGDTEAVKAVLGQYASPWFVTFLFNMVSLAGVSLAAYARFDDFKKGRR